MTKAELVTRVEAKKGFHSIIEDKIAPDNTPGDPIEKHFFYVNHLNADGTMGKTYLFYLYNPATDEAWFYNTETETIDAKEPTTDQKKIEAFNAYLAGKYEAFFIERMNLPQNWVEADVFTLNTGKLTKKKVIVRKKGTNPIVDIDVV